MFDRRPSHKECAKKIRIARELNEDPSIIKLLNPVDMAIEANDLGYLLKGELIDVLKEVLDETQPENYVGKRPPEPSYKAEITGCELYAFKVFSSRFQCDVYFKFAIKNGDFWLVSLHRDRQPVPTG